MEESKSNQGYYEELPRANPIQKKTLVTPRSIFPLLSLPSFKYSQQQIDLAPSFSALDQKQQHILKQPILSKLFFNPDYQATTRYLPNASNLKFACVNAFYSESGIHPQPVTSTQTSSSLVFQSRFESGNLAFATKSENQNQYYLLLQKDINTTKCTQWFFFCVKNNTFKGRVKFYIINFLKNYSSFQNGMKISFCSQINNYTWTRGCDDIKYIKNNIKISGDNTHYSLTFTYNFQNEHDTTYFAHSPPYTFSMLDRYLLNITNNPHLQSICKRRTLTESLGGNYIDMLTIANFKSKKQKKVVFITSRVHPGESPSSFVCEGIISYILSNSQDAKKLRENFIFKIIPMLNPDGVINGNYRCSLSGYDLNRIWHIDSKINSPEIYYTKAAILDYKKCFMFIDLHAHSKKKGVFMYGCQSKSSPFISRHIPYLLWKQVGFFNYYQCNFGMKIGREGTSRLSVHRMFNLPYSYTMEHSFCSPMKQKYHFTSQHFLDIGKDLCYTLRKYFCSRQEQNEQILKDIEVEFNNNKELMSVGMVQDKNSSDDSELDEPSVFKGMIETKKIFKRKQSINFRFKILQSQSSSSKFQQKPSIRQVSPRKLNKTNELRKTFHEKIPKNLINKKYINISVQQKQKDSSPLQMTGQEVYLSARIHQRQEISPLKAEQQTFMMRATSRYQFQEMESLNNLFLPSLTSASYKRYAKKKNYNKQFIQVGKKYLEANGLLKEQIKSVSKKKPGWREQILSYI